MVNKFLLVLSFLTLPVISGIAQTNKGEVFIISTIHQAHRVNPNYSYDSLFSFIEKFDPDIIGVEIRKEDINSAATYLRNNYPFEMYETITKYPSKEIFGFDWLGEDLVGRAIPENYWKEKSPIKKLQRKLSGDSILQQQLSITDIIQKEKEKLALNATIRKLNDGRYDLINDIYYQQLKWLLKDTEFKALSDFYEKRDKMIAENIVEIIKNNKGKKMIFLLGADHRSYTLKKVLEVFDGTVNLNDFKQE